MPLSDHSSYDALNTKLHFRVGMAVYEAAAAANSLDRCAIAVAVLVLMGIVCCRLGLRELAAPEGWDVGILYYWLGEAFRQQHKLDLAVDLLEKALRYREATLGKTHKDTLYAAFRLARALSFKGELHRALELYEELALAVKVGTALALPLVLSALGRRGSASAATNIRTRSTPWASCTAKKATWTAQQSCLSSRLIS